MSPLLGFTALEEIAPVLGFHLDIEFLGSSLDALPGAVALGVSDAFDLIETSNGVADMLGVRQRFFSFLRESEFRRRQVVLLGSAEAAGLTRDFGAVGPGTLHLAGVRDVSPCRGLLLGRGDDELLVMALPSATRPNNSRNNEPVTAMVGNLPSAPVAALLTASVNGCKPVWAGAVS